MDYLFIYVRRDSNSGTLREIYGYEEIDEFFFEFFQIFS